MKTILMELLDTLGKTYYTRNCDASEARALKDLHALKFHQETIKSEGKRALKQDAFFSSEEEKIDNILQETAARKAALENERRALSRIPFGGR